MADRWERLATRTGGTVAVLTWAPDARGQAVAFAGTTAGVHKSVDGGRRWTSTSTRRPLPFVQALAPSPGFAGDRTLVAGTRQGAHRSTDGGATWQTVLVGSGVLAVAYAGTTIFVGTETDGILRSEDGGRGWGGVNAGLLDLAVLALAVSPRHELDSTMFAATASGLYRSRNGGKSWRTVDLPLDDPAVQCLAVSPDFANDKLVLAGTEENGLLRSDDGGSSWEPVPELDGQGVTAVAFSTRYGDRPVIALATGEGVCVSTDGGVSWSLGAAPGPSLSLAFVPDPAGEALLAGPIGEGVVRSTDEGIAWASAHEGPRANLIAALVPSPEFAVDATLFAAGLEDGVAVSSDGGESWSSWNVGLDDLTVMGIAVSPDYARDATLFAATGSGIYRSRAGAETWERVLSGVVPTTLGAIVTTTGTPWRVMAAVVGKRIMVSDDAGATWSELGADLDGEVIALAASPEYVQDSTIFAATAVSDPEGGASALALWRSTDGGAQWECWMEGQGSSVLPLSVRASGTVLVGLHNQVLKPLRGAQEVVKGVRRPIWRGPTLAGPDDSVTALAASPNRAEDDTVFAATSDGVWLSRDGGDRFERWSEGLSPPSILTLAISPDYATDRHVFAVGVDGTIWKRTDN